MHRYEDKEYPNGKALRGSKVETQAKLKASEKEQEQN
jgi:hypothetical protein